MLIHNETGKIIKAVNDWRFNVSLEVYQLEKGTYTVVVDPIWNNFAKQNLDY